MTWYNFVELLENIFLCVGLGVMALGIALLLIQDDLGVPIVLFAVVCLLIRAIVLPAIKE